MSLCGLLESMAGELVPQCSDLARSALVVPNTLAFGVGMATIAVAFRYRSGRS